MQRLFHPRALSRIVLYWLPAAALALVLFVAISKVALKAPEFDEAELLHGSWLIAHGGRIWIDVFEHHSPLFNTINARLFDTDSVFFTAYAKAFALLTYLVGIFLFCWACYLWLGVSRVFRTPFFLYVATLYVAVTWPVDIGVVRPENYGALTLALGAVLGFRISRTSSPARYVHAFLAAFLLGASVFFSPRSVILAGAVALAVMTTLGDRRDWLRIGAAAVAGGIAIIAINLAIAPLKGFLLWTIDFNRLGRPYRRALPPASYGSIVVALISLVASGLWATAWFARTAGTAQRGADSLLARWRDLRGFRALFVSQIVVIICWIYVFADHIWGRQSFGGIAIASAFCAATMVALALQAIAAATPSAAGGSAVDRGALLVERLASAAAPSLARPAIRIAAKASLVFALCAVVLLAYLTVDKVDRMMGRLQIAGMVRDIKIAMTEKHYRLKQPNDLPPLSEVANLGEWLKWSRRYCELFGSGLVLANPHRHPVCARDATYYWYAGEHFRAMAKDKVGFVPDPPYTVVEDLMRTKPAFIDAAFLGDSVLPNEEVEAMLRRDYAVSYHPELKYWAWIRNDVLARP
jgi:hypothetical protein